MEHDKVSWRVAKGWPLAARRGGFGLAGMALASFGLITVADVAADSAPAKAPATIPWSQLGAKAGADYKGDGLAVIRTAEGARLRCVFQRLEGEATPEGLWLTSPATNNVNDRFRVVAAAVGRTADFGVRRQSAAATPLFGGDQLEAFQPVSESGVALRFPPQSKALPRTGTVSIDGQTVRFNRAGLAEEYTVSMDGVRQDFIIEQGPDGAGELALWLDVNGARIEPTPGGAQLVLENSDRKIAYNRLHVTDATGRELPARMEVLKPKTEIRNQKSEIVVVVNDTDAVYPLRVDPTFSDANWISMGGIDGVRGIPVNPSVLVYAAVTDGVGNLYVGGDFTIAGDVIANHIAKWDGKSWTALGSGVHGEAVYALAVSGTNIYAGGYFTNAGGVPATYIAKWDGNSWSALDSGMNGGVFALAVSGGDLYAGGYFTTAGGIAATNIAKWNGSAWSALGSGMNDSVRALAGSGANLYAGGYFTLAGGSPATNIAKWDGNSWSALGAGPGGDVRALAMMGSDLYVGGRLFVAWGSPANGVAKWNGSSWSALGSGTDDEVYALAVSGGILYAGGDFRTAGGGQANCVAKWNGNSWSAAGSGLNRDVYALAVAGSNLYAGGWFTGAGANNNDTRFNHIAKWNGSSWSAVGSGFNSGVATLAVSGTDLYVGGIFTTAGNIAANYIAKWNGSGWSALGLGMDSYVSDTVVFALAVSGSDLYAGGTFTWVTNSGGVAITVNGIARWDGTNWSALGSGLGGINNPTVHALAMLGSDLYVGGFFPTAGGITAYHIAKWNGGSWEALGLGMSSPVSALAVSGSDLYAGGGAWVTNSGGVPINVNGIAKWDGTSWSALGSGVGGVSALAVSGNELYAAGASFSTNRVAKWNGNSWSALDSGYGLVNKNYPYGPEVYALAVVGSNLYAGGYFTTTDGSGCNNIAKWDGSSWSALGSGMDTYGTVHALAVSGGDLYVGGGFITAGGKVSASLAKANLYPLVLAIEPDGSGGYFISFSGVPGLSYRLQRAQTLSGPWTFSSPQTAPASGSVEFWDLFPPPGQGYYRSVQP